MGPPALQISRYRPDSTLCAYTDGVLAQFRTPRMDGLRGPDRAGQDGRDYETMKAKDFCGKERPLRKVLCQLKKGHKGSHRAIIYWEDEE